MRLGRFNAFPLRFGGGEPLSRKIYNAINSSLGTALDTSEDSTVTAETSAEGRLIAAAWGANSCASNQLDPDRVTDFIARWEAILGIPFRVGDSDATRRARIKAARTAMGNPCTQTIVALCTNALGSLYVNVEFVPLDRVVTTTDNASTMAHILIRVACPPTMSRAQFIDACQYCISLLQDFLPDYDVVTWGEFDSDGERGFLLDDPNNLDSETFD